MKAKAADIEAIKHAVKTAAREVLSAGPVMDPRRPLSAYPQRMTLRQVGVYLSCTDEHVANLYDEGLLLGIDIASPGAGRRCLRIFRDSVQDFEAQGVGKAGKA